MAGHVGGHAYEDAAIVGGNVNQSIVDGGHTAVDVDGHGTRLAAYGVEGGEGAMAGAGTRDAVDVAERVAVVDEITLLSRDGHCLAVADEALDIELVTVDIGPVAEVGPLPGVVVFESLETLPGGEQVKVGSLPYDVDRVLVVGHERADRRKSRKS